MLSSFQKDKLRVRIFPDRTAVGFAAASDVAQALIKLLSQQPEVNMIFAAAPSQNEFLATLATIGAEIDWSRINAFHMDEYVGLSADAPQGFGNFLRERIFSKLPFRSVNYLNGSAQPEDECKRYAALLQQQPIDIVCMGIGENGHVAFNDPHVARFDDPVLVKVVDLDETCRMQQVNDGCFEHIDLVPTHAFTLTIPALMRGGMLFCMVPAKTKAWAVYHTVHDPVSEAIPATCLRTHGHAILYADADSGAQLLK